MKLKLNGTHKTQPITMYKNNINMFLLSFGPAQILTFVVLGLILNVILARLIAKSASHKKINYWTVFFVSFFFSPIVGLLLVIASPSKS